MGRVVSVGAKKGEFLRFETILPDLPEEKY